MKNLEPIDTNNEDEGFNIVENIPITTKANNANSINTVLGTQTSGINNKSKEMKKTESICTNNEDHIPNIVQNNLLMIKANNSNSLKNVLASDIPKGSSNPQEMKSLEPICINIEDHTSKIAENSQTITKDNIANSLKPILTSQTLLRSNITREMNTLEPIYINIEEDHKSNIVENSPTKAKTKNKNSFKTIPASQTRLGNNKIQKMKTLEPIYTDYEDVTSNIVGKSPSITKTKNENSLKTVPASQTPKRSNNLQKIKTLDPIYTDYEDVPSNIVETSPTTKNVKLTKKKSKKVMTNRCNRKVISSLSDHLKLFSMIDKQYGGYCVPTFGNHLPTTPSTPTNYNVLRPFDKLNIPSINNFLAPTIDYQPQIPSTANGTYMSPIINSIPNNSSQNAAKPKTIKVKTEEEKTAELKEKVREIINKLNIYEVETLLGECVDLSKLVENVKQLQVVADLLFEEAIRHECAVADIARICMQIQIVETSEKNKPDSDVTTVKFRQILVARCKSEFQKKNVDKAPRAKILRRIQECSDLEKKKKLQTSLEEEYRRLHVRFLGNVRLIGEFFKLGLLNKSTMFVCLQDLLDLNNEESLESLCILLTSIGRVLERERKQNLQSYFHAIQDIVDLKRGNINNKIKDMLLNVVRLRENGWRTEHCACCTKRLFGEI